MTKQNETMSHSSSCRTGFFALSLSTLLLVCPQPAGATGQCDLADVEAYDIYPDSFPSFVRGNLGVLRPRLMRLYLPVGYLYLSGATLDEKLRKEVEAVFVDRSYPNEHSLEGPKPWLDVRNKFPGITPLRQLPPGRLYWDNCLPDSFVTAARTLSRIGKNAAFASQDVRDWIDAQDAVFQNCHGGKEGDPPSIPAPVPGGAGAALKAERDYQIAAAYFYSGNYSEADQRFAAISKQTQSPWAPFGVYLQARANIRRTLVSGDPSGVRAAQPLLEQVVNQPISSPIRLQAERLLGLVLFRTEPGRYLKQITAELRQSGTHYIQRLIDYHTALLMMVDKYNFSTGGPQSGELSPLRQSDDMTDWILLFSGILPGGDSATAPAQQSELLSTILARYDAKKTLPWLVAALVYLQPGHPRTEELLAAAAKVPTTSPAAETLAYHAVRLLKEDRTPAGQKKFAARLAAELKAREQDPPSALRNYLKEWALPHAKNLDDALHLASRFVLGHDGCDELPRELAKPLPALQDAVQHLTEEMELLLSLHLPLSSLAAIVDKPTSPAWLRTRLAGFVYARGLLLGETDPAAAELSVRMESQMVQSAEWKQRIVPVRNAKSDAERRFAKGLLFLHESVPSAWMLRTGESVGRDPTDQKKDAFVRLVSASERQKVAQEWKTLSTLKTPLRVATEWTIQYGSEHPEDERIPQALLKINQQSKYANDSQMSRRAYEFMHKTYPNHPLTKKVKYWY